LRKELGVIPLPPVVALDVPQNRTGVLRVISGVCFAWAVTDAATDVAALTAAAADESVCCYIINYCC
jgi:hypothetical protein